MGIIKNIQDYFEQKKKEREEEKAKKKEKVTKQLFKKMTKEEVDSFNHSIIIDSAGWVGGSYTEKDIKLDILSTNRELFTEDEITDLKKMIKK